MAEVPIKNRINQWNKPLISELEDIKHHIGTLQAWNWKDLAEPCNHSNLDVILAAIRIGLDYVELWNSDSIKSKKTIIKFEDLFQNHLKIYNNEIKEAKCISETICKAAILSIKNII